MKSNIGLYFPRKNCAKWRATVNLRVKTVIKKFKQKCHLNRHKRTLHGTPYTNQCPVCHLILNRKDNFARHMKTHRKQIRADPNKENVSNKRSATDLPDNAPRKNNGY